VIHPGQKLSIPGLEVPATSTTAQQLAQVDVGAARTLATVKSSVTNATVTDATAPALRTAGVTEDDESTADAPVVAAAETVADFARAAEAEASPGVDALTAALTAAAPVNSSATVTAPALMTAGVTEDATAPALMTAGVTEDATADADILRNLLDTLPDLGIRVTDADGAPRYTIRVEAEETLGHFADWLGIGGPAKLREMNQLRYGRAITVGQVLRLPVADARMAERFERRRTDYHQVLSESLKEHYNLTGIESYTVQPGDSAWELSIRLRFPVWLLYRLNPILRTAQLKPGQTLILPKLSERS